MWHPSHTTAPLLPDVTRFLDLLNSSDSFFEPGKPLYVARAPGRLDLMGGIADYSGALVLEMPLALATLVAVQATDEPLIAIDSTAAAEIGGSELVTLSLNELCPPTGPLDYERAHRLLTTNERQSWAAYIAGVLVILQRELGVQAQTGMRILVHSEVPLGKGVSSSAALEVASMQAMCALLNVSIEGEELARLCQKVENYVVGAPCGIMDQMTSACGIQDSLLALLCQPAQLQGTVQLPAEIEVWGVDSGVRHAVTGSDYNAVRVGAFMGYRIVADLAGLKVAAHEAKRVTIDDPYWSGYLAKLPPSLWETTYRDRVPLEMSGADFLARYGGSTDPVTRIDPQRLYAVRQPAAHPIYEHHRVRLFRTLLAREETSEEQLCLLGELMYQSHASYSACGLGSDGTDRLVELVREAGPRVGLYGAKITGGGSGGTVAILARKGARARLEQLVASYQAETGRQSTIMNGSSPGAVQWGIIKLI